MSRTFHLHIATPERDFFSSPTEQLIFTTPDGEMGVLAGHASTVVTLAPGPMYIKHDNGWHTAAVIGGFARIKPDYVTIFADTAEWPEDIEEQRALLAKRRAEAGLKKKQGNVEYLHNRVALDRALVRLTVKHSPGSGKSPFGP